MPTDFPCYSYGMVNRQNALLAKLARESGDNETASAKTNFDGTKLPMVPEASENHHIWYER